MKATEVSYPSPEKKKKKLSSYPSPEKILHLTLLQKKDIVRARDKLPIFRKMFVTKILLLRATCLRFTMPRFPIFF